MTTDRFGRLLVIIPDRLSDLVRKGEVTERYYNPGDLFREIHLFSTSDDHVEPADVAMMAGTARLTIHNVPPAGRFFARTFGWRRPFINSWLRQIEEIAKRVQPQLIRCHGADLNLLGAAYLGRKLAIPYVVSLHNRPDQMIGASARERLRRAMTTSSLRRALAEADATVAVYRGILPYLARVGVRCPTVAYNVVAPTGLRPKIKYGTSRPFRVISVGRQLLGKNPLHLLDAVASLDGTELTLIGDGPLHETLRTRAIESGAQSRIHFARSWPNRDICSRMAEFDLFAIHNDYWGIPKTVIEALLIGMPVLINRPDPQAVPELSPEVCHMVPDTVEGWRTGLQRMIGDQSYREKLARAGRDFAAREWSPDKTEACYVELYRRILDRAEGA